jgi:hypothetical protein
MSAGASRGASAIAPQPALAPSPQPRPDPTARAQPPGLVEQGGQNWTPIGGQICAPIDSHVGFFIFRANPPLLYAGYAGQPRYLRRAQSNNGLNPIAKERGEFEKTLAKSGIKVQWLGPFPNHAPTLLVVTGGSADFNFGDSTTPALAAIITGSPLVFTQFMVYEPRTTACC